MQRYDRSKVMYCRKRDVLVRFLLWSKHTCYTKTVRVATCAVLELSTAQSLLRKPALKSSQEKKQQKNSHHLQPCSKRSPHAPTIQPCRIMFLQVFPPFFIGLLIELSANQEARSVSSGCLTDQLLLALPREAEGQEVRLHRDVFNALNHKHLLEDPHCKENITKP